MQRASMRARLAGMLVPDGLQDQARVPAILHEIVAQRINVIVSGATGSRKATLSKAMIAEIPRSERLIAIEDAKELGSRTRTPAGCSLAGMEPGSRR